MSGAIPDAWGSPLYVMLVAACGSAEEDHGRYERTGQLSELERAIAGFAGVLGLAHNVDIRSAAANGLGTALWSRYERFGDPADLDKAIGLFRAALAMYADEQPATLPSFHANLASVLRLRWRRSPGDDDLAESVAHSRAALVATGPTDSRRSWRLNNLADGLLALALHHDDSSALNEAVVLFQQALGCAGPEDDIAGMRSNHAEALRLHYRWGGGRDRALLDQAVEQARAALAATAPDHPLRARFQSNLALILLDRFQSHRHPTDLADASAHAQAAVAGTAKDNPNRAERLHTLAGIHRMELAHTAQTPKRRAARRMVKAARAAAAAVPHGHYLHADALINLGWALGNQAVSGDAKAFAASIDLFRRAALDRIAPIRARVNAARRWAITELAREGRYATALEAFELAVALLPRAARRHVTHADRQRQLAEVSGLARDAAACAVGSGDPHGALRLLEHGRGVLLSQALDARTELTELRQWHPGLSDRFEALRADLDRPEDTWFSANRTADALSGEERHAAAQEWDRLLDEIRALPEFADFLRPPKIDDLLAATVNRGPISVVNVSGLRCDALLLADGHVRTLPLRFNLDDVVTARHRFRSATAIAEHPGMSSDARDHARRTVSDTLRWLWTEVTGPVLEALNPPPGARLWWVPTGPLTTLPLHAAISPEGVNVLDQVVSSYAPTVRSVVTAWRTRPEVRVGAPLVVALTTAPGVPDLPSVDAETAILTGRNPGSVVIAGERAVRRVVLDALPRHPWVHFACHAVSAADGVADGHLVLHDHATAPLTVADIARLRLDHADLAYLSACDTGVAHEALDDEALHIAGACHMAGFRHVVGTLWAVKDSVAPAVASTFYAELGPGDTPAHALHRAVCDLRAAHPASPTLWAPYVHVGP